MPITIPWLNRHKPKTNGAKPPSTQAALKLPDTQTVLESPPAPKKTMHGWPMGKALQLPEGWRVLFHPQAMAKLEAYHRGSGRLEVSGYAMLDQPVKADPAQPYTFYVKDLMLICTIEESTGGYTEMAPELRAKAMMQARAMGYKANQLAWWHKHPVTHWSSIDVDTLRQRVHETGLPEALQAFAFVLTPSGVRARWDHSGPGNEDNVYVDNLPIVIGTPETLEVIAAAECEVAELLAARPKAEPKPANGQVAVPQASWKRPALTVNFDWEDWEQTELWDDSTLDLGEQLVMGELIYDRLSPDEATGTYVCRKDIQTLVNIDHCVDCPFAPECFAINQGDVDDALRRLMEEPDERPL
jgi:hypothetical protein